MFCCVKEYFQCKKRKQKYASKTRVFVSCLWANFQAQQDSDFKSAAATKQEATMANYNSNVQDLVEVQGSNNLDRVEALCKDFQSRRHGSRWRLSE